MKSALPDLPVMMPPASSIRVTMVASKDGSQPAMAAVPFVQGIPAMPMLSCRRSVYQLLGHLILAEEL